MPCELLLRRRPLPCASGPRSRRFFPFAILLPAATLVPLGQLAILPAASSSQTLSVFWLLLSFRSAAFLRSKQCICDIALVRFYLTLRAVYDDGVRAAVGAALLVVGTLCIAMSVAVRAAVRVALVAAAAGLSGCLLSACCCPAAFARRGSPLRSYGAKRPTDARRRITSTCCGTCTPRRSFERSISTSGWCPCLLRLC